MPPSSSSGPDHDGAAVERHRAAEPVARRDIGGRQFGHLTVRGAAVARALCGAHPTRSPPGSPVGSPGRPKSRPGAWCPASWPPRPARSRRRSRIVRPSDKPRCGGPALPVRLGRDRARAEDVGCAAGAAPMAPTTSAVGDLPRGSRTVAPRGVACGQLDNLSVRGAAVARRKT